MPRKAETLLKLINLPNCRKEPNDLGYTYVSSTQFAAVFGILFRIENDLVTFIEAFIAFGNNCREMNEHIVTAVIVGNEAEALFGIEPFYCTIIHIIGTSINLLALMV